MNKDKEKVLLQLLATSMMLGELANSNCPREQKERTIRKCANPKKKAMRKLVQASRRKNRR
jgi:hypothetical protein